MAESSRVEAGRFGTIFAEASEKGLIRTTVEGFIASEGEMAVSRGSRLSDLGIDTRPMEADELLGMAFRKTWPGNGPYDPQELACKAAMALKGFLEGKAGSWAEVTALPVDESSLGGGFTGRVLALLRHVPPGRYITYGKMAEAAGSPKASRAVGAAMASNPLLIVVPCHRVFGAGGRFTGFGGGLELKAALNAQEQYF